MHKMRMSEGSSVCRGDGGLRAEVPDTLAAFGTVMESRAQAWSSFGRWFGLTVGCGFLVAIVLVVALDPFDTGRFPRVPGRAGVHQQYVTFVNASRGRDERFRVAMIGSSTVQLLEPGALAARIGMPVTALISPGAGAEETLAVADWVVRSRRTPPFALILGVDGWWCTAGPSLAGSMPFPLWLYGRSDLDYVRGMVRLRTAEHALMRVQYLAGRRKRPPARPDGYSDYEGAYQRVNYGAGVAERLAKVAPAASVNLTGRFPALEGLDVFLEEVAPETIVVLLLPPVFINGLPATGSDYARSERQCKERLQALAAARPRTVVLDWRVERPETRAAANFYDHIHMRGALARMLEPEVAAAVNAVASDGAAR
jgi:hypothetical protein